ncbi:hypothetical protein Tco_0059448 [Tanacetum coccineum]
MKAPTRSPIAQLGAQNESPGENDWMSILMRVRVSLLKFIRPITMYGASTRGPVLIDDINDDNKLSIIRSVVHKCDSPDLNAPLERHVRRCVARGVFAAVLDEDNSNTMSGW